MKIAEDKQPAQMKGRRVTVDLTAAATAEVERLKAITGLPTSDIFRHALSLFRLYVEARERLQEIRIVDPKDAHFQTRIELPIEVRRA